MDRAARVTAAIMQLVTNALRRWPAAVRADVNDAREPIEAMLRDEVFDIQRSVHDELHPTD